MQIWVSEEDLGASEAVTQLWKGHFPDKRELTLLAAVHQIKMQAEICENHTVLDSHEENKTKETVSGVLGLIAIFIQFSVEGSWIIIALLVHILLILFQQLSLF